jgi:hypothetical protein
MVGEVLLYILVNGYMGTVISDVCLVKGKNKYCSFLFLEVEVNAVFVLLYSLRPVKNAIEEFKIFQKKTRK